MQEVLPSKYFYFRFHLKLLVLLTLYKLKHVLIIYINFENYIALMSS